MSTRATPEREVVGMASDQDFVDFIVDQLDGAGEITSRKMFGEYVIYCDGKVVALVCDNRLFIKPTQAGRAFIGDVVEAPPYPGARNSFLIEEQFEDRDWISKLVTITTKELPEPKPKKKKPKAP
jgi:TfoX/Sxy family transcriptional regulator of competence genes